SAGTGPINGPEVVSGVLELDGREEFFDLDSLQDLIGVRIRQQISPNRFFRAIETTTRRRAQQCDPHATFSLE
ncbi:hypothetical protein, partial [Deinococcus saxicola]|uniref:hypothetical protein n=1 Tax=Deinococcus saxicola TaxID=249406 RepID=UPI0039F104F1